VLFHQQHVKIVQLEHITLQTDQHLVLLVLQVPILFLELLLVLLVNLELIQMSPMEHQILLVYNALLEPFHQPTRQQLVLFVLLEPIPQVLDKHLQQLVSNAQLELIQHKRVWVQFHNALFVQMEHTLTSSVQFQNQFVNFVLLEDTLRL
jgi:hypothetical protein